MRNILISCIQREIENTDELCELLFAWSHYTPLPSRNRWLGYAKLIGQIRLTERVPHTSIPQAQAKEFG